MSGLQNGGLNFMGRNKLPEELKRKRHTFRLSKNAKETLKAMAQKKGTNMSVLLEKLIYREESEKQTNKIEKL